MQTLRTTYAKCGITKAPATDYNTHSTLVHANIMCNVSKTTGSYVFLAITLAIYKSNALPVTPYRTYANSGNYKIILKWPIVQCQLDRAKLHRASREIKGMPSREITYFLRMIKTSLMSLVRGMDWW